MTTADAGAPSGSTQEALTAELFGAQARAYVTSADHATGADLQAIADLVKRRGGRVLDVGSGGGHASYAAAGGATLVVSCDLTGAMLHALRAEARARALHAIVPVQAAAAALPFADASFDSVVTRYSAHHWTDLEAGLRAMRRVLVDGGQAAFIDVIAPAGPAKADTFLQTIELLRDPSHVRDYSLAEWLDALERSGFDATRVVRSNLDVDIANWLARIGTAPTNAQALHDLSAVMPAAIRTQLFPAPGRLRLPTVLIEAST